tara:strand:+ start:113 stop:1597 length:1485 start_codon:yes stop_codon:yes gene_type:complete
MAIDKTVYATDNTEKTADAFYKKEVYNARLQEQQKYLGKNLINFNFAERSLYGKIDMNFAPISLQKNNIKYISAAYAETDNNSSKVAAVNFVVDAYMEMARQFEKAVMTGKISTNEAYLSNLKVYKAYEDPHKKYADYHKIYADSLASFLQKEGDSDPFVTFEQFIDRLMPALTKSLRSHPFTKTGFIKSKYCPHSCSGLVLEIADLSYSNDQAKMDHFINNKNWNFFVKTCSSHGFMVDQNIPWRIIANIGSREFMTLFARRYMRSSTGVSPQTLFNRYYDLVHVKCYRTFKFYLLSLYNQSRPGIARFKSYCNINGETSRYEASRQYDPFRFENYFSEEYFLRLYCKFRFLEEESKFTTQQQEQLIREMVDYYGGKKTNLNAALYIFEYILNKTFDYIGSISYINKAIEARRVYEEERMLEHRQQQDMEPDEAPGYLSKIVDGTQVGALPVDDITSRTNPFRRYGRSPNQIRTNGSSSETGNTGGTSGGGGY